MPEQPQDPYIDPATGRRWTKKQRVQRALARRLPRTAHAWRWLRAKAHHYAWLTKFRTRGIAATWRGLGRALGTLWTRYRQPGLTVGIDVTPLWHPLTGVGWYLYRILEEIKDDLDLKVRLYGPYLLTGADVPAPVVPLPTGRAIEHVAWDVPHDLVFSAGWIMKRIKNLEPLLIALDGNRTLFAPNFILPARFALARGQRVVTVHDLGLHRVPETLQEETRDTLAAKLRKATHNARRLITVSNAVRDELVEFGYAPPAKIDVVYHGPGQLAQVAASQLPDGIETPFALHVGTLEPRKNILRLLDAWEILAGSDSGAPLLVLCGKFGWKTEEIEAAVADAEARGLVRHLGYVAEGELAALYQAAAVVVFPTRYEGFGLPAVEAQQAGAPLVCSDLPVLREVAGDGALYTPVDDAAAIARTVGALLSDSDAQQRLRALGRANAGLLNWRRAADLTTDCWRRAADLGDTR